jgi:hypothetical protein
MGNTQSNQNAYEHMHQQTVHQQQPNAQKIENFVSGGSSPIDGFKVPNWFLPMLYMCMIIFSVGAIIAAIYQI